MNRAILIICILGLVVSSGCTMHYQYHPPDRISESPLISEKIGVLAFEDKTDRNTYLAADRILDPVGSLSQGFAKALVDARVVAEVVYIGEDSRQVTYAGERLRQSHGVNYVLYGEVTSVYGRDYPKGWAFIPPIIVIGIPALIGVPSFPCGMDMDIAFDARIMDLRTQRVVWSESFRIHTDKSFLGTFYYAQHYKDENVQIGFSTAICDLVQSIAKAKDSFKSTTFVHKSQDIPKPVHPPPSIRNVHVLVIGVKDYQDKAIPALKYSDLDAKAIYGFFKSSPRSPARPENVHFLGDAPNDDGLRADRKGIMKALSAYLMEKATDERDMAILYFSGHGDAGKHPTKNAAYYLIPRDAERSDLYNTAIELDELQNRWKAIRAGTKIMIADACNAGGFSGMKNLSIRGVESVQSSGTIVMASASANQKSLESDKDKRGLFTQVFLEGLEGRADDQYGDRDGRVSLGELRSWLEKVVPKRAAQAGGKQTPVVKVPDGWDSVYLTR